MHAQRRGWRRAPTRSGVTCRRAPPVPCSPPPRIRGSSRGSHHQHGAAVCLGQERGERALGAPRSAVLDDDDRRGAVVEEGAHAVGEERTGIVVDDDGANGGPALRAQYSLEKRKRTSAASALKPSRQVIFLPSSGSRPA